MKSKIYQASNYRSFFFNGKTVRQKFDYTKPFGQIPFPEILDVAINAKCHAGCSYCYTSAVKEGSNFSNIIEKAYEIWGKLDEKDRPYQIACLDGDTPVNTPDGKKPIKNLKIGDVVFNENNNEVKIINTTITKKKSIKLLGDDGFSVICSEDHLFLDSKDNLVYAKDLLGKSVKTSTGRFIPIHLMKHMDERDLYDISLEEGTSHLFTINNDVITHNCGGAGEPTLHPDFSSFMRAVKDLGIMPNYTTNGMHITDEILKTTEDVCGGVAISFHPHIEKTFHKALAAYSQINTKLNTHVIVGDEKSLVDLKNIYDKYYDMVDYFVILPYQNAGRAKYIDTTSVWKETFEWVSKVESKKFALGALFYKFLQENDTSLKISVYDPEVFSGYIMLDDNYKNIYNSSYDLTIKKVYENNI